MKSCYFAGMSLLLLGAAALPGQEPDIGHIEKLFRTMPMEARRLTGPLFWLHGDETPDQLRRELEKVVEGHNGTFTAEPRPHKDWLGESWFRDLDICVKFARQHNLTMVIYDDWWWPSQMMGGRVPPQYGSKRLKASATSVEGPQKLRAAGQGDAHLVALVAGKETADGRIDGASLVNVASFLNQGTLAWDVPQGKWRIMKFTWEFNGNRGGQQRYISVDGASPECVDWFIKTVYQPHYDRFKEDFGKTIVGYFYDEPETQGDWGTDLPRLIAERGLDLNKLLVAYQFQLAGEEQTAAYYAYLDCFAESWGRTMYGGMSRWCRQHKVESHGHFMEHNDDMFSRGLSAGNMMQLQKYSDMGGIDLVCGQVYPGQRKLGVYEMPRIASSIAHTFNKDNDLAFCEVFGGYNQNLTYPEMRWLTDWLQVRGVNYLVPHSFNPRAPYDRDFPPYFYNGGHEPRWPLYRVWADYTNRLSLMLTGGRHVCPVAFLHLGQSYHVGAKLRPEQLTSALEDAQFDCDWLLYEPWEKEARLEGKEIKLHKESYKVLVVPAAEVIPYATLAKARDFFLQGGVVVGYGMLPSKSATLGKGAEDIAQLREAIWGSARAGLGCCKLGSNGGRSYFLPAQPTPEDIRKVLVEDARIHPTLEVIQGETNHWLHVLHRQKCGRDVFFVCNQDHKGPARSFRFRMTAAGEPEVWDAMRNEITAVPYRRVDAKTVDVDLTLEPSESVLLVYQSEKRALPERWNPAMKPVAPPIPIVRQSPSPAGRGEGVRKPAIAPPAEKAPLEGCSWVWYPESNPAVSAPAGSRYFRGRIVVPAEGKIKAARFVLSADNEFTLWINGRKVGERTGDDEAWRRPETLAITEHLKTGVNQVAILATNLPGNGPNPAGLIGRYTVEFDQGTPLTGCIDASWKTAKKEQSGWTTSDFDDGDWMAARVVAAYGGGPWGRLDGRSQALTVSPVTADPFVGAVVLPASLDLAKSRIFLEMDELTPEAAARVTINDHDAGGLINKPLRLEVTSLLHTGNNTIRIEPFAPQSARLTLYAR